MASPARPTLQAVELGHIDNRMSPRDTASLIQIARSGGDPFRAEPLDLGARVRSLRKAHDWTLEQAAQKAGLARSTLSKIENGQMSPTYDALKKLAQGLEISIPQLFTAPQCERAGRRMSLTRSGQGAGFATATYEHDLLGEGLSRKQMLPYRTRIRARSMQEFDGWVRHDGEEFLYVLTGIIQLYTEFHEPVEMRRGDSAYYDATMGHNVISLSSEDATVLWVTSMT